MPQAPNHSRRRFWSSVVTAFVTVTWLSLAAFQSYTTGRWLINALLVAFMLGLWLVARRLSPEVQPDSPGPLQFSLSKLLMVVTTVAIVVAMFAWFEREHQKVLQEADERLQQILDESAQANSAATAPPTQPVETPVP